MTNSNLIRSWMIGALSGAAFCIVGYGNLSAKDASPINIEKRAPTIAEVDKGRELYQRRCGACHSIETNRIGPKHRNIFDRKAGSEPDYTYSDALAQSALIWNEQTLDQWLSNPEATIPGQKMGYRLSNAEERKAIIAYLRSQSQTSVMP